MRLAQENKTGIMPQTVCAKIGERDLEENATRSYEKNGRIKPF